jgi:hypothetical protein
MKVVCITDELNHYYDKGVEYEVYRWEKEYDNIWIKDNLGGSDCWGEKVFLTYFKWL